MSTHKCNAKFNVILVEPNLFAIFMLSMNMYKLAIVKLLTHNDTNKFAMCVHVRAY